MSDLSLLHFTSQFLHMQIKDSDKLMRKHSGEPDQAMSKQVVLRNILKCLEVDRLLLNTYNAIVFARLKKLNHEAQLHFQSVAYEKEAIRFVILCVFKRAFLIMQILEGLSNANGDAKMAVVDNQE